MVKIKTSLRSSRVLSAVVTFEVVEHPPIKRLIIINILMFVCLMALLLTTEAKRSSRIAGALTVALR